MMLFVTLILIGGGMHVFAAAPDGECFLHDVFQSFSNEKVKLALTARDVEDMKKDLAKIKTQIDKSKKIDSDCQYPVAFFAKNENHKFITTGTKVTYDTILTDTCKAFDKVTGTFICPKNGVYIFHCYNLNDGRTTTSIAIYKNGAKIVRVYADDPSSFEGGGNSALLQLKKGDNVYVGVEGGSSGKAYLHGGFNSFSGHIIQ